MGRNFRPLAQWLEQQTFTGRHTGNGMLVRCKFGEPFQMATPSQARKREGVETIIARLRRKIR